MATRRLRRKNNHTKKRKNVKKGGSIQCIYDKPNNNLHITIPRPILETNLSGIRTACEKAIEKFLPEKPKASVAKAAKIPVTAEKKSSFENLGDRTERMKIGREIFGTEENLHQNIGMLLGRRRSRGSDSDDE